jgi:general secretion pathway protein G
LSDALLGVVAILTLAAVTTAAMGVGGSTIHEVGHPSAQIANFVIAIDMYEADVGRLPTSLEDLRTPPPNAPGWKGPYLRKEIPKDPWGRDYIYELRTPEHGELGYIVRSLGPDGAGEEGEIDSDQVDARNRLADHSPLGQAGRTARKP